MKDENRKINKTKNQLTENITQMITLTRFIVMRAFKAQIDKSEMKKGKVTTRTRIQRTKESAIFFSPHKFILSISFSTNGFQKTSA